jgi:PST family polysaccharide transporter
MAEAKRDRHGDGPQDDAPVVDVDRSEWRRRSVHGAAASMVSQGIRLVVQTGTQVMLARLLTPSAFGLVAMAAPVIGFAQLFGRLGLLEAVVQRPKISQAELSGLFWINVGAGAVLAALLFAASPLVAWVYAEPRTATITQCLGGLLIVGGFSALPMALMNRRLRFVSLAAIDVGSAVVTAAVGIGAALAGWGYWSLVWMQIANAFVTLTMSWWFAGWRPSWPRRVAGIASLLRFGSQVTASSLVLSLSYTLDDVLVGMAWGTVPLGLYDRGFRLMLRPVMQIATPFQRVAVPLLSRLQGEPDGYRAAYTRLLQAVLFATTPVILFAICMAHRLVPLVLGQRWDAAVPFFVWFGLGALLTPVNASTNWLFISQNRTHHEVRWNAIGATISLLALLSGLPWGATSAAATKVTVGALLWTPLLWRAVTREGPVRLTHLVCALYPTALAGTAVAVALSVTAPLLARQGLVGLAGALALSYAVYALCYACVPEGNRALHALLPLWRRAQA